MDTVEGPLTPNDADHRNAELVRLLADGHRKLLAYVSSLVGNRHDAEDVLQRASLIMWRQFHTFELGTDFLAWASAVVYYEARNFLRVSGRARVSFDDELLRKIAEARRPSLERVASRVVALEQCVESLDESNRKLLLAIYGEEISLARMAELLGKAPKTLANRLTVIRQALANCIERRISERGAT